MKSRQTRDLTQGSIYGNLFYMALPTMFGFCTNPIQHRRYDLYWYDIF